MTIEQANQALKSIGRRPTVALIASKPAATNKPATKLISLVRLPGAGKLPELQARIADAKKQVASVYRKAMQL
jgi:hypothetical protein